MERNTPHTLHPELLHKLKNLHNFVVLDVETTGFDCRKNRIIEIGMLKIEEGKEVGSFSSFINPGTPIPTHITTLTGITDSDVQSAPTFEELADSIVSFVGTDIIVGHNVPFDIGFVSSELMRCGIYQCFERFDTLTLARKTLPALKSHKLSNLIEYLGFCKTQSHRALDDARWTLKVLTTIQGWYKVPSLDDVIHSCRSTSTKQAGTASLEEKKGVAYEKS